MRYLLVFTLLAGCTSLEEKQAHNEAQIKMIAVQREAQEAERLADANAKKALYEALASVAKSNPDQAGAVTVALAVQGITEEKDGATPIVQLQREQNTALEVAKVVLPSVVNLATGLGVAAINADVAKTQSDNSARIQINDAEQDAAIVNAVASLGSTAVQNSGTSISVSDNGYVNTGTYTEDNSVLDSYNTTDNSDNSDNSTTTTTNTYEGDESVTYEGQSITLAGLLDFLRGTGSAYSLTLGGTVYTIDGDGEPVEINCNEPQFSPAPIECR